MSQSRGGPRTAFAVDPRSAEPNRRLDVYRAVGVAAVAVGAYLLALITHYLPPQGLAIAFFGAAPIFAAVALVVLVARARAEHDGALAWFAAGLAVGLAGMLLQLIGFPLVAAGGGILGTSDQASATLYLAFHLGPALGAVAGAFEAPRAWRRPFLLVWLLLLALVATDLLPLPYLLRADRTYTPLLIGAELVTALAVAVATVVWVVRTGRTSRPLRAWVGVALSLMVYDLALNALGAQRFTAVWWASLSLRVGSFAVLGVGTVLSVLGQLRDLEAYADRELDRREEQLRHSLGLTSRLLSSADDLAAAVTTADVAAVLGADAVAATAVEQAAVLLAADDQLRALGRPGWQVPWTGWWRSGSEAALFLDTLDGARAELPGLDSSPLGGMASLALLPLPAGEARLGMLVVGSPAPRTWTALEREVLLGLAAQGGQAIARASAFESEREAAETLQRSLLPAGLPTGTGLSMAARYLPGERGVRVGGDWYDVVEVAPRQVALVVGDVMGKGLHAAAVMGQLRTALRALAVSDPAPPAVLQGLDRLTRDLDVDEIATLAYVLLDLEHGTARVARAGHLPPLLVSREAGPVLVEEGGSPPLGAPAPERAEHRLVVPPGSLWVLYTDGLVEDRATGLDRGLPDLLARAGALHAAYGLDAEAIATHLLDAVDTAGPADDIALLLAGFGGATAPEAQASMLDMSP